MQFDYEFEEDDSDFLFDDDDDSGAISWQDLLSDDDDSDKKTIENKDNENKTQSISDFDITSVQDNVLEASEGSANNSKDLNVESHSQGMTPNYVSNQNDGSVGNEKIPSIMDETNDSRIKLSDKDVSDVLDDELLNILNDNRGGYQSYSEPVEQVPYTQEETPVQEPVYSLDDSQIENTNTENSNDNQQNIDYQTEDIVPNQKKKGIVPILVIIAFAMIFTAILFLAYSFLPNSSETSIDIENAPVADETNDISKESNVAITRQQAKEIEEKEKSAEKSDKNSLSKDLQKVVVNVPFEGRRNPFVPSAMFDDESLASIGADFSALPDINPDDPEAVEARKLFSISVSGIMYDSSKPSAILRFDDKDYFVQKGDRIDTYIVHQITKDYVAIRNAANIYKAYVGESFAVETSNIPPSNQMKTRNGQRQYISSEDVAIKVK